MNPAPSFSIISDSSVFHFLYRYCSITLSIDRNSSRNNTCDSKKNNNSNNNNNWHQRRQQTATTTTTTTKITTISATASITTKTTTINQLINKFYDELVILVYWGGAFQAYLFVYIVERNKESLHFYFPPKAGKYINGVVRQSSSFYHTSSFFRFFLFSQS